MYVLNCDKHEMFVKEMNKKAISPYNDKRWIFDDGVKTFYIFKTILRDKSKINNKYNKTLFLEYDSEIQYFKLNIKETDVYYSSVYINNEYNQYFHSRDYEALINVSKEVVELIQKEEEDKDDLGKH